MFELLSRRLCVALMTVLGACSGQETTQSMPVAVQTQLPIYTTQRQTDRIELTIVATYRNRSDRPIYVVTCGGPGPLAGIEKQVDGRWKLVYSPLCADEPKPLVVAPGGVRMDTLQFVSYDAPNVL
ncbi:MAG TPA: hypothetical protein VHG28_15695, partial [Longimicrobiaceae bacterium]|nr:hypothetical protein [Longimicrobiaceae bacterium]